MKQRVQHGFTLIELLVVVAIIAILAAVLFPVFFTTKEKGRQQKCIQNLKQLTMAMRMYADDYNSFSPNPNWVSWPLHDWTGMQWWRGKIVPQKGQIWRYVRNVQVYECPSDVGVCAEDVINYQQRDTEMYDIARRRYGLSYSMNADFYKDYHRTISMDCIRRTREVLLLIHESRRTINDGGYNWYTYDDPSSVHVDGTTVAYVDCHAVWKPTIVLRREKQKGIWDPLK